MGIVGILKTKEGFIGFGDGKCTASLFYDLHDLKVQEGGPITKTFANNNCLLCINDNSEPFDFDIEDYILKNIGQKTFYKFLIDFQNYLNQMNKLSTYNLIVAEASSDIIKYVEVNTKEIHIRNEDNTYAIGGLDAYSFCISWVALRTLTKNNRDAIDFLYSNLLEEYKKIEELCERNRIYNPTDDYFQFGSIRTKQ